MAEAKKYEYNGQKKTVYEWSKETGIAPMTIMGRLKKGWNVEKALTTIPDSKANLPTTPDQAAGRELKDSFVSLALQMFKRNRKHCAAALNDAFKNDPIKTMKDLALYLPKDAVEKAMPNQEKAVVRIELVQPAKQIEYVDIGDK